MSDRDSSHAGLRGITTIEANTSGSGRHPHSQLGYRRKETPSKHGLSVDRIVTTLPSATEIVSLLGLEDKLVGITHECDFPPSVSEKPVIIKPVFDAKGMTSREIDDSILAHLSKGRSIYEIDEELLAFLRPDLIITQELCEVCATPLQVVAKAIARLEPKPTVISLSPHDLEDVLKNVIEVGLATGRVDEARRVVTSLRRRIEGVKEKCFGNPNIAKPSVFCLEWLDPIYCSGHWMPELVDYAGGVELLGRLGEPSTVVPWRSVVAADPEVIFVTVCGYSVERTLGEISALTEKKGWSKLRAVRNGNVFVLDSPSYYSRSGPRLVDGLEIMASLLHPELFPDYRVAAGAAYSLATGKYLTRIDRA
ncbi:MAG: cobalamin-binding protein [Thaumarchaeota archaeon]|nr:cobalamin-binding protein [Nitrososphaerota archaeon]